MNLSKLLNRVEETVIASLLGIMTVITFANVIVRYVFNSNILWALELTVFLFGWLVLLGASYAVKKNAHLGVDILINHPSERPRRLMGLLAAGVCIAFCFLMLKGAWDYWANFANLPGTEGRWFPTGFQENFRPKGWYEVNDIPLPLILRWMEPIFNDGNPYEMIPRFIPYAVLPFSMALLLFRFIQAFAQIWRGTSERLIASHEVEDEMTHLNSRTEGKG